MLFTGDSLFSMSIGRTDFPHSVPELQHSSIYKLTKLDKDITIYPGHGDSCSLKEAEPEAYL
jgi:glyoxylase-like metal-dependent hydrolase (beta-lactamase superfamily II)